MEQQLQRMTDEIVAVYKKYEATGTKPWTYEIAARDLVYQVGSLMKLVMQRNGERFVGSEDKTMIDHRIGDELADIMAETLFIARELNIDIESSWRSMVASDESKIDQRLK